MAGAATVPALLKTSGPLRDTTVAIPALRAGQRYALVFSIRSAEAFGEASRVTVDLRQGKDELLHKTLHFDDPDFYALFRAPRDGPAELHIVVVSKMAAPARYRLRVTAWPGGGGVRRITVAL